MQPTRWLNRSTVKWPILAISLLLCLPACGPKSPEGSLVGVPDSPRADSSLDSLLQGLRYIREHPTEREDERVQRFLWVDQWASILQQKSSLNPDLAKEFWRDLTAFVSQPPMSPGALNSIVQRAETQLGRNVAYYQIYMSSLRSENLEAAMTNLSYIRDDKISDLHLRAEQLLQLQGQRAVSESRRIGVLAPLSGKHSGFGDQLLNAVQILNELAFADGIEFVIADSGDNNDQLLDAFQKLTLEQRVAAIIGPVTAEATQYIFERAQILRVPVVSLAPRENLEFFGKFNFRSTLTIEDQIDALARLMRGQMGARRVGILFPDSNYGWDVIEKAQKVFRSNAIEITEMQMYAKDATDFKEELKQMTRLDFPRLRADELCPKEAEGGVAVPNCVSSLDDLAPLFTFEVLFVPDFADKVGLILPTLPFLRMYGVQVVGLSGLNSPRLIERGQQAAEGVIFTDSYIEDSKDERTKFFVQEFTKKLGSKPSKLSAEAFDVGLLLIEQMRQIVGPVTREELVDRIAQVRDFPGVTGRISVESNQLRKEARLMLVRNQEFQEFQ